MLPKIDANFGRRASRRDCLSSRSGVDAAVVPLPRLRLLKQVGGVDDAVLPARIAPSDKMGVLQPPRLLLSRADFGESDNHCAGQCFKHDGADHLQPSRRGRGLLRPLDDRGQAFLSQPPRSRSPPPLRNRKDDALQDDLPQENVAALLQQRARERVKEQRRQRRRLAREEEERRQQDEQERTERAQRAVGQIEAHRRELARQAADRVRRSREDREDRAQEREELESARRERMRRYQTPAQIRELRRLEHNQRSPSRGSHIEDDCEIGDVSMPRRAARAPSAEIQDVRERRRGSRGRARSKPSRQNNASECKKPPELATKSEESLAVAPPVSKPDMPEISQPPPMVAAESLVEGVSESIEQLPHVEVADQHGAAPVGKPDTSKVQEHHPMLGEEALAEGTPQGVEQLLDVEAPPGEARGEIDDIRQRLCEALDLAIETGALVEAMRLLADVTA